MIEMILAKLCRRWAVLLRLPGGAAALLHLSSPAATCARSIVLYRQLPGFVDRGDLQGAGADHRPGELPRTTSARLYTDAQAEAIVEAALDAGDAIDCGALRAHQAGDRLLLAEGLRFSAFQG
jgi:hypothetical protein